MFKGTYTALVTPFRHGQIDEEAFERLIDMQINGGVTGIVPVGTTGESPTLDHQEHLRVVELAVKFANGRCHVLAGTGSNSTREAVELTQEAEKLGVTGCLLVAPYYNKPSQEGLYRHFMKLSEATKLPLVLYSIPGRCGVEIAVQTIARLVRTTDNVVAIKEAGGSVERVSQMRQVLPDHFEILSGDDSMTLPFMAVGGVGVVSVASNLVPTEVSAMVEAALAGEWTKARTAHERLYRLFKELLTVDVNPVPIKTALAMRGLIHPEFRLPLCEPGVAATEQIRALLSEMELLTA